MFVLLVISVHKIALFLGRVAFTSMHVAFVLGVLV